MKKVLFILGLIFISAQLYAQKVIEKGVVKEYKGRQDKTPLSKVQLKAKGCNWATSDDSGAFKLEFNGLKVGSDVENVQVVKTGFVVFNRDVVKAWRLGTSTFEVVMCDESKLIERQQEYFNIYDTRYKQECKMLRSLLSKERAQNKLTTEQFEARIKKLEEDSIEKMARIDTYAERFAYIDESEINETEYTALQLFKNNQIEEAIRLYEKHKVKQQLQQQIAMRKNGETLIKSGQDIIQKADSNSISLIRMLQQEIELYKLGGKRYYSSLIADLNTIISAYRTFHTDKYKKELADALYDLGKISEDDWDYSTAYECFRESSELGHADSQYRLAHLMETRSEYYDFEKARELYQKAAGANIPLAIDRVKDLWDFYEYNQNGIRTYYKIIEDGEHHTVKITYRDLNYESYDEHFKHVPSHVEHNGITYVVTEIGRHAFDHCDINSLILPETITRIGDFAFTWTNLERFTISKGLESLGIFVFEATSKLAHVDVDEKSPCFKKVDKLLLSKDGTRLFLCERNAKDTIIVPSGVEIIEEGAFDFCDEIVCIKLPNSIKTIRKEAFDCCSSLESCFIPDGLEEIGEEAFDGCEKLKKIRIPSSVKHLGINIFSGCIVLNDIQLPINNVLCFDDGVLYEDYNKKRIIFCSQARKGVVNIPESVTDLQKENFYNCHVNSINFSHNIDTIPDYALWFCKFFSAIIPSGVRVIKDDGFYVCRNLVEIMLPQSVNGIGNGAFYSADCLGDVYSFTKTPAVCGHNAFDNHIGYVTLHVPFGCGDVYRSKQGWEKLDDIIEDLICEEDINESIHNSNDPQKLFALGLLRKSQYNYSVADSLFACILNLTKNKETLSDVYYQRGLVAMQLGNWKQTTNNFKNSLQLLSNLPINNDTIIQTKRLERKMRLIMLASLIENDPNFFAIQFNKVFDEAAKLKNYRVLNQFPEFLWIVTEWNSYLSNYYPDAIESSKRLFQTVFEINDKIFTCYVTNNEQYSNLSITNMNTSEEKNIYHLQTIIENSFKYGLYQHCIDCCNLLILEKQKHHRSKETENWFIQVRKDELTDLEKFLEKYRILSSLKLQSQGNKQYSVAQVAFDWGVLNPNDKECEWVEKEACRLLKKDYKPNHMRIAEIIEILNRERDSIWNDNVEDLKEAMELYYDDKSQQAIELFIDFARKRYRSSLSFLGRMCQDGEATLKDRELAKQLFQLGLEHGDSTICNYLLGVSYLEEDNFIDAASCFMNSELIASYYQLAKIIQYGYAKRFNLDEAVYIYKMIRKQASESRKKNIDHQIMEIASKYNELAYESMNSEKDINKALEIIDKAIELCPDEPNFVDSKGELLLMSGDVEGAVNMWKKVLEIDPDALKHWEEKGIISVLYKKLKEMGKIQ